MRWLGKSVLLLALVTTAALASDLNGIWMGQDIALQFKVDAAGRITGKLFGDEIDLPVEDASLVGDKLKFTITTTNYYSGVKVKFVYSGTVAKDRMELSREKQTFMLKKLVS